MARHGEEGILAQKYDPQVRLGYSRIYKFLNFFEPLPLGFMTYHHANQSVCPCPRNGTIAALYYTIPLLPPD